ncbi:hypothetical protein [Streptomyces sp. NBC_00576]|uniref:hypothetical protein n=1 Tax=Streptomyces sp. NBC_00576 TaxID=2903665 RepID=UPI002E8191FF|nr:hypothetical protein [Streptomyces sp. NBC_00576]WUB74380.1 hypothetical protein OG734_32345 [Streptomyces sp. NBC_00576]
MAAEHDGVDALMAALTDDPLPEGALTDADFMAEHWSAAADVALLREQLGLIGGALASQERTEAEAESERVRRAVRKAARVPVRERRYWRPLRTLALGVAAVAAAGTLSAGSVWLLSQAGNGVEDSGASSTADSGPAYSRAPQSDGDEGAKDGGGSGALTRPGYLACARLVVEGTVAVVERGPVPGQDRITLDVTRYYKPDKGPAEVTFVMDQEVDPRLAVGDHTLIGIVTGAASPDTWALGDKEIAAGRAGITAALPESRTLSCG